MPQQRAPSIQAANGLLPGGPNLPFSVRLNMRLAKRSALMGAVIMVRMIRCRAAEFISPAAAVRPKKTQPPGLLF